MINADAMSELLLCQVGASYVLYDTPLLWAFGGTPRFCW